ncbi:hypothetical protein L1987_21289 [Smallanthus sonchifolius]|uniref:Uncharacterized protein n=1 Tax=Smallanthus sonchifolius TaxID=185202 RepID=A0ACB9IUG9_9ASTR|nr:hypothetical protein L1987_21289 [Smallanthus sonchifolius]
MRIEIIFDEENVGEWENNTSQLKSDTHVFSVLIEEESGDWIPDCLVEVEEEVHVEEAGNDDVTMASDDVSPGVNGGDEDLNFLEGANLVENEQSSFPEIYKDGNVPNIQETFSNHLLEGSNDRDILKKGGKGYRKKSRKNNSFSPLGQERPKKRPREFPYSRLKQGCSTYGRY